MSEFPNWFDVTAKINFDAYFPQEWRKRTDLRVLQIGVFTGDATAWLHKNTKAEIHDVDTWGGSEEAAHDELDFSKVEKYYDNRFKDKPRVIKYKMTSNEFFSKYPDEKFDLIYVDGDHTASQVAIDGLNAVKALKDGGIIAFDDFTWQSGKGSYYDPRPGIEAVGHICAELFDVLVVNSQAWIKKKDN